MSWLSLYFFSSNISSKQKENILEKHAYGYKANKLINSKIDFNNKIIFNLRSLYYGNQNLILCERGVSMPHTHRSTSRFALDIQAIPALKEITKFPIISDPSHASFWAPWVPSLTFASISAGCDGLIIEMHPNPKKSAVDPLQPLNFKQFKALIKKSRQISKVFNRKIVWFLFSEEVS